MSHDPTNPELTETIKGRYNRLASAYDRQEAFMERRMFAAWRRKLWARVSGPQVLEVGVGTGKNMPYYPPGVHVTAIDFSPEMLALATRRAEQLHVDVDLREMDVEHLDFPPGSFDTAVATFVFCSVPFPVRGLQEMGRVVRPEGQILLLEHMRARNPVLGALMDVANPMVVRRMGANINRRTVDNVRAAGLRIVSVEELSAFGIFRLIEATP